MIIIIILLSTRTSFYVASPFKAMQKEAKYATLGNAPRELMVVRRGGGKSSLLPRSRREFCVVPAWSKGMWEKGALIKRQDIHTHPARHKYRAKGPPCLFHKLSLAPGHVAFLCHPPSEKGFIFSCFQDVSPVNDSKKHLCVKHSWEIVQQATLLGWKTDWCFNDGFVLVSPPWLLKSILQYITIQCTSALNWLKSWANEINGGFIIDFNQGRIASRTLPYFI